MQPLVWQNKKDVGLLRSFFSTIQGCLLKPKENFGAISKTTSFWTPLSFCLCLNAFVYVILIFFYRFRLLGQGKIALASVLWQMLLVLAFFGVFSFFISGVIHLFARMFKGTGSYQQTFAIVAYGSSVSVFNVIPVVGIFISLVWGVVISVIAVREIHQLSAPKAFLAFSVFPGIIVYLLTFIVMFPVLKNNELRQNENVARQVVIQAQMALDQYAFDHDGKYPSSLDVLVSGEKRYLAEDIFAKAFHGYSFQADLGAVPPRVTATPVICGKTGRKQFSLSTSKTVQASACVKNSF